MIQDQNLHRVAFEEQGDDDDALFLSPLSNDAAARIVVSVDAPATSFMHTIGPYDAIEMSADAHLIPRLGIVIDRNTTRDRAAKCASLQCLAAAAVLVLEVCNDGGHRTLAIGPFMQMLEARATDQHIDALLADVSIRAHELGIHALALDANAAQTPSEQLMASVRAYLATDDDSLTAGSLVLLPAAPHWVGSLSLRAHVLEHATKHSAATEPLEYSLTLSAASTAGHSFGAQRHALRISPEPASPLSTHWLTAVAVSVIIIIIIIIVGAMYTQRTSTTVPKAKRQ